MFRIGSQRKVRRLGKSLTRSALSRRLWLQPLEDRAVPTVTYTVSLTSDSGAVDGSDPTNLSGDLRYCLSKANSDNDDSVITFKSNVTSISLTGAEFAVTENKQLTITGNGSDTTALNFTAVNAGPNARLFNISAPLGQPTVTLTGMVLANGAPAAGNGGAILVNDEALALTNVRFVNNKTVAAGTSGGAIATAANLASIVGDSCTFSGNTSIVSGGAVFTFLTTAGVTNVTMKNSTFTANTAGTTGGGAIFTSASVTMDLSNDKFTSNKATTFGGAIGANGLATINLTAASFSLNTATTTGGAIHVVAANSNVTLNGASFTNNAAGSASTAVGGAINAASTVIINASSATFTGNTAGGNGGAINTAGTATITANQATFSNNVALGAGTVTTNGGAINTAGATTLTANHATFNNNSASGSGGGLSFASTGSFTATGIKFITNTAGNAGGGLRFASTPSVTLDQSQISGNKAGSTGSGGGLYFNAAAVVTLSNSSIYNNQAGAGGGGIRISSTALTITQSTLSGNTSTGTSALTGGGAILFLNTSSLTMQNSTVTKNVSADTGTFGGGIFTGTSAGTVTLDSTIVADNTNPNNRDFGSSALRSVLGVKNLIGAYDTAKITLDPDNLTGTEGAPLSPGLLPLADNGGPTLTHLPAGVSSAVVDHGFDATGGLLTTDQRGLGFPRQFKNSADSIDIGATEFSPDPYYFSSVLNDLTANAPTYTFSITYADDNGAGIDTMTLAGSNVSITGGPAMVGAITLFGTPVVNGNKVTATYSVVGPGGSWDVFDQGTYSVNIVTNQVKDGDGNAVRGQIIGSFIANLDNVLTVDNSGEGDDSIFTAGQFTLREACVANQNAGTDTIQFAPALSNSTITLMTELSVTQGVTIQGLGASKLTITSDPSAGGIRAFNINVADAVGTVTLSSITLTNNSLTTGNGGAILVDDDMLVLNNMVVSNNMTLDGNGGAIAFAAAGQIVINDSVFDHNSTNPGLFTMIGGGVFAVTGVSITASNSTFSFNYSGSGGAIGTASATTTKTAINNCKFLNNTTGDVLAATGGGAIRYNSGILTVTNSVFTSNTTNSSGAAQQRGGAIYGDGVSPTLTIANCTFSLNMAGQVGGAVGVQNTGTLTVTIFNSMFDQNTNAGNGNGAAVYCGPSLTAGSSVANCVFSNNVSQFSPLGGQSGSGGAFRISSGTMTFNNCQFTSNTAASYGGAISDSTSGNVTINLNNCNFTGNVSQNEAGGAIGCNVGTVINANSTTFTNNSAALAGGAIANRSGVMTVNAVSSTFSNNTSGTGGGAIFLNTAGSAVSATLTTFDQNSATSGGAIGSASIATTMTANSCTFTGNSALTGGAITSLNSTLTINNSTLSGNSSTSVYTGAGAIALSSGATTITNSTLSGNVSKGRGGSAIAILSPAWASTLNIFNSTIANNTATSGNVGGAIAGLSTSGTIKLNSTILAGNVGTPASDINFTVLRSVDSINSLIGAVNQANVTLNITGDPTLIGTEASPVDPGLLPLGNYGGPTQTHALTAGSKAINNGNNTLSLTTDQRGNAALFPRVIGSAADIGAFEGTPVVPTATATLPNVIPPSGTDYIATVVYQDENQIDTTTIKAGDLQLVNAAGFSALSTSVDITGAGTSVTAKYHFTPPGGTWDVADQGIYTVSLVGTVQDNDTTVHTVTKGTLGTFIVGNGPQTYVVTLTTDEDDGNYAANDLSLREAIKLANANPRSADTISFSPTVFAGAQTITLTLGEMAITDSLTINGKGVGPVTIQANGLSRHFNIDGDDVLNVTLTGLTLTGGVSATHGGSILDNNENLTLSEMKLNGNAATGDGGAVHVFGNTAKVVVLLSMISNNQANRGGGIRARSTADVSISRSTISGNHTNGNGGGVYFFSGGSLTITASTLSGNSGNETTGAATANAAGGGGAIYFFGGVEAGGFTITNTTISGNQDVMSRGGAIVLQRFLGTALIRNSTITNNTAVVGGGITNARASQVVAPFVPGTVVLQSTILAGNGVSQFGSEGLSDFLFDSTADVTANFNLIGVMDPTNNVTLSGLGNQNGDAATPLDAKLGSLADNGGPTLTQAPQTGSPAIDAGKNFAGLTFDQRDNGATGFARNFNEPTVGNAPGSDGTDIGAFEFGASTITATLPAKFSNAIINSGAAQRSRVLTVQVNFNSVVTISGAVGDAFTLKRLSDNATVGLNGVLDGGGMFVTLTFTGGTVDGKSGNFSLQDGRYALTVLASHFTGAGFDGNGDGIAGDDLVLASAAQPNPPTNIFRLYGDADGNGTVNGSDFLAFRLAFLQPNTTFDFDADGTVTGSDFLAFRLRFLQSV